MGNVTDDGGVYRQDAILGPFAKDKGAIELDVPHIEEIKAIHHDGEIYYNAKDLMVAMRMMAFKTVPTLSVFNFIKQLTIELLTARR